MKLGRFIEKLYEVLQEKHGLTREQAAQLDIEYIDVDGWAMDADDPELAVQVDQVRKRVSIS